MHALHTRGKATGADEKVVQRNFPGAQGRVINKTVFLGNRYAL